MSGKSKTIEPVLAIFTAIGQQKQQSENPVEAVSVGASYTLGIALWANHHSPWGSGDTAMIPLKDFKPLKVAPLDGGAGSFPPVVIQSQNLRTQALLLVKDGYFFRTFGSIPRNLRIGRAWFS